MTLLSDVKFEDLVVGDKLYHSATNSFAEIVYLRSGEYGNAICVWWDNSYHTFVHGLGYSYPSITCQFEWQGTSRTVKIETDNEKISIS